MKTHEKYITEVGIGGGRPGGDGKYGTGGPAMISRGKKKKPYPEDLNIKDMAQDLTGEIEVMISNLIDDWMNHNEFGTMRTADIKKMVNLAIKNINLRKIL